MKKITKVICKVKHACTVKQCVILNIFSILLKGKFTVQWNIYLMLNLGFCQSSNFYFTLIVYSFERYIWTPLLNYIKKLNYSPNDLRKNESPEYWLTHWISFLIFWSQGGILFKIRIFNTAFLTIHFVKKFQNFEFCFIEMPYNYLI